MNDDDDMGLAEYVCFMVRVMLVTFFRTWCYFEVVNDDGVVDDANVIDDYNDDDNDVGDTVDDVDNVVYDVDMVLVSSW